MRVCADNGAAPFNKRAIRHHKSFRDTCMKHGNTK